MHFTLLILPLLGAANGAMSLKTPSCPPFPSSMIVFSSEFAEPNPPFLQTEYKANFVQHKWNQNLSHITTGFVTNSPSGAYVSADEAFDGGMARSLFNYANTTQEGLVDNTVTTYASNSTKPDVWRGYVNSGFPLFQGDLLIKNEGVFGGLVKRQFIDGNVAAWNIMYEGAIPVTVYVNNCNVLVGYDFFAPSLRTGVITEYFNVEANATSA